MYAWVITKDLIFNPEFDKRKAVGIIGPRGTTLTTEEIKSLGKEFRMLDSDNIVYYHGYMVEDEDSSGFEPLEDFGEPNAGACIIQYKNEKGKWS